MNLKRIELPISIWIWSFIIPFLSLIFLLLFTSRPAADDHFYIGYIHEHGADTLVRELWNSYSGRWFSNWLISAVFSQGYALGFLMAINGAVLLLFFLALSRFLRAYFNGLKYRLWFALLFWAGMFFAAANPGQIFFWASSYLTYLSGLTLLLFAFTNVTRDQLRFLTCVAAFAVGGMSESMALAATFLLFWMLIFGGPERRMITTLALIFLVFGLVFNYLSPGSQVRAEILAQDSTTARLWTGIKGFAGVLFDTGWIIILSIAIFTMPFGIFEVNTKFDLSRFSWIALICFTLACALIPAFILGDRPPIRALLPFFFMCTFIGACFWIEMSEKIAGYRFLLVLPVGFALVLFIRQIPKSMDYANAYDERFEFLTNLSGQTEVQCAEVKPLPPSGLIFPSEITEDSSSQSNLHLVYGVGGKFSVKRKPE